MIGLIILMISIFWLVWVIWNLIFRYYRITLKDDNKYYVETLSWLIPFYWHGHMWSDGERDFAADNWGYTTFEDAKEKVLQFTERHRNSKRVKSFSYKEIVAEIPDLESLGDTQEEKEMLKRVQDRLYNKF